MVEGSPGKARALAGLHAEIRACTRCPLHRTRTQAVPGAGPADARVMLVGEAPGRQEDEQGQPFVGRAGQFLDELLDSIGLPRAHVYITNVVKSRPFVGPPPGRNRPPAPAEVAACRSWLDEQIKVIQPEIIVAMGRVALEHFAPDLRISQVHGKPLPYDGRTVLPVFHPSVATRWPGLRGMLRDDFTVLGRLLAAGRKERSRASQKGSG
jgi:DNA polymerase